ncbi:MAG TPA: cyanophycinase [Allocoleopsis sp.]
MSKTPLNVNKNPNQYNLAFIPDNPQRLIQNMLQQQNQSFLTNIPQSTKTAILVIGGAEDKVHGREILHTFFHRAGGPEAKIGVIPSASREPAILGERYRTIFTEMGAKDIAVLDIRERQQSHNAEYQEYVKDCSAIFLTGGDQLRLCGLLADTPLMEKIRMRVKCGEITLAGTSAGAAVMGHHMIAGGGSGESPNRSLVDMATGLGMLPEIIVDQHFHNRNRMGRLISAIFAHPDRIGIGIDEDTCALFESDGVMQVIGKGNVTIIDPESATNHNSLQLGATDPLSMSNLKVHLLSHGDRYHINQRLVLSP